MAGSAGERSKSNIRAHNAIRNLANGATCKVLSVNSPSMACGSQPAIIIASGLSQCGLKLAHEPAVDQILDPKCQASFEHDALFIKDAGVVAQIEN